VTVAALAIAGLILGLVVPRIRRAAGRAQESVGAMGIALERMFGAFRTIKTCGAESQERQRINEAATAAWSADVRAAKWQSLASNVAGLAIQAAFLAVLGVGGARVASGAITVGTLIAFLLYVYYLLPPIQQLASSVSEYQIGTVAVARISEAEGLPVEPVGAFVGRQGEGSGSASLALEEVRFRYRPELPEVLRGISLSVPPRGLTALVGLSGAGKTTIFTLIERLYDTDSGRITIDGMDVRDWPIATLRATIGYVEQDAPVLSGTLRENLVLGAPGADEEALWEVLRMTRLSTLVNCLPDGLATQVGHRGTRLSGGERQRVAIARALVRSPRLLLLDEATSQLDAINEAALRDTLTEVARTTTVLVVAHRLSTVSMADRIVVIDAGQVRAVGTHAELLSSDELYGDLAATQFLASRSNENT
jgi:ABC-type multidrug transport system fused ATPase/permease subunit